MLHKSQYQQYTSWVNFGEDFKDLDVLLKGIDAPSKYSRSKRIEGQESKILWHEIHSYINLESYILILIVTRIIVLRKRCYQDVGYILHKKESLGYWIVQDGFSCLTYLSEKSLWKDSK